MTCRQTRNGDYSFFGVASQDRVQHLTAIRQERGLPGTQRENPAKHPSLEQTEQCVAGKHHQASQEQERQPQQHVLAEDSAAIDSLVTGSSSGPYSSWVNKRMKWTPELHTKFVCAVKALGGAYSAKPKDILDMLRIPGLSINHVKSHLQKYRLSEAPFEAPAQQPAGYAQQNHSGSNTFLGQKRSFPSPLAQQLGPPLPMPTHVPAGMQEAGARGLPQQGWMTHTATGSAAGHSLLQHHLLLDTTLQHMARVSSAASGELKPGMPATWTSANHVLQGGVPATGQQAAGHQPAGWWIPQPSGPQPGQQGQPALLGSLDQKALEGHGSMPAVESREGQSWQMLLSLASMLQQAQQHLDAETAEEQQLKGTPTLPNTFPAERETMLDQLHTRVDQLKQSVVRYAQAAAVLQTEFQEKLQAHIKAQLEFHSQLTAHIEGIRHLATDSLAPLLSQLTSLTNEGRAIYTSMPPSQPGAERYTRTGTAGAGTTTKEFERIRRWQDGCAREMPQHANDQELSCAKDGTGPLPAVQQHGASQQPGNPAGRHSRSQQAQQNTLDCQQPEGTEHHPQTCFPATIVRHPSKDTRMLPGHGIAAHAADAVDMVPSPDQGVGQGGTGL